VDTAADIDEIEAAVTHLLEPVVKSPGDKVAVVVNYDAFSIVPGLVDAYRAAVERLTRRFYTGVTRYGTGGFLKAKLDG
jgi:propionate CoA-transferase